MKEQARITHIAENHPVTCKSDSEFWFHYQRAILLVLKDYGILNEVQFSYGEACLKKQAKKCG